MTLPRTFVPAIAPVLNGVRCRPESPCEPDGRVVLFITMLGVQAAVYFPAANIAQHAGTRAVSVASRRGASPASGAREAASVVAESGSSLVGADVSGGESVSASVTVRVARVVPFFPESVTRRASAPKERFIPEDER